MMRWRTTPSSTASMYALLELGHTLYIALTTEDTHRSRALRNMSSIEQLEGEPSGGLAARRLGGSAARRLRLVDTGTVHGHGLGIGAQLMRRTSPLLLRFDRRVIKDLARMFGSESRRARQMQVMQNLAVVHTTRTRTYDASTVSYVFRGE